MTPKKPSTAFRLSSTIYFLTYRGTADSGQKITKESLAIYLLKQNPHDIKVRPVKYLICEQTYHSGESHFHVILAYEKRKQITTPHFYDYLGVHPNIQTMRNMKAALQYVHKEDTEPVTNMDIVQQKRIARAKNSSSLYQLLQEQMFKDPFNFNVYEYCLRHNITRQIYKTNYGKAVRLLKDVQQAYCNQLLTRKPGFKIINQTLIRAKLTELELKAFYSWSGYQTIVNYLNQVHLEGNKRQMKTKNLLITGPPHIGKTSLFHNPNHKQDKSCVQDFCAVYHMGMNTWFPKYQSNVYDVILWNEAKLTSYSYDTILKLLEGSYVDLPIKGGIAPKRDNPLIVMTSNMTLQQMIVQKFNYSHNFRQMARKNLAVRIQNIVVPEGHDLFFLQKLICPST